MTYKNLKANFKILGILISTLAFAESGILPEATTVSPEPVSPTEATDAYHTQPPMSTSWQSDEDQPAMSNPTVEDTPNESQPPMPTAEIKETAHEAQPPVPVLGITTDAGQPDSSPSQPSESDIESILQDPLNLSSYELYMLTDVIMELVMRPCSFVNRPVMSSIKKFMLVGISQVPNNRFQHPMFFENYKSLADCLSDADEVYSKLKTLEPAYGRTEDDIPYRRMRREVEPENQSDQENLLAKEHETVEEKLSIIDSKLSFEQFFGLLLAIVHKTCPRNAQFDLVFLLKAINEVMFSASVDRSVWKLAQLKYFHNTNVLGELEKCDKTVNFWQFQASSYPPAGHDIPDVEEYYRF